MAFRVQFFWFQQSSKLGGWSENYWINTTDQSFAITQARAFVSLLNQAKGAQVLPSSFRISQQGTSRLVYNQILEFNSPPTTIANDADYPSTALLLKLGGAGGYTTLQWFRGIPDSVVSNSGRYIVTPTYPALINPVLIALANTANLWCLRVLDRTTPKKVVTALDATTGIVTCPAHGYGAPGGVAVVRIKGFAHPAQANKVWRISVIDSNTFQLSFWQRPTDTTVFGKNPTSTLQSYIYVQIGAADIVRATNHYTGRPTGLLGGRRRIRAS